MTNDETRMTNPIRNPNDETSNERISSFELRARVAGWVVRHSSFVIDSSFGFRHSDLHL